jgi:hypothetical protein
LGETDGGRLLHGSVLSHGGAAHDDLFSECRELLFRLFQLEELGGLESLDCFFDAFIALHDL